MSGNSLEGIVLRFLERRETTPTLAAEAFAAEFSDRREEVLNAVQSALAIERLLPSEGDHRPDVIAGYAVLEEIGRGGMGVVYHAERGGEAFALKVLPGAPWLGARALERFRREAETLARLSDPGIVRVHGTGVDGDVPYIVMDRLPGRPLHLLASSLSLEDSVHLVERIARTIHGAHEQGIVHRDLKPQNVIVLADGQPVLVDFGLSAAAGQATLTATGDILGTPRYMSPEQRAGADTDRRTDIYALGLILYELTTGRPAQPGRAYHGTFRAGHDVLVPAPRSVRPALPRPLDHILRTALARDPDRRYPTSLAMADDLRRFLEDEPVLAHPHGSLAQAAEWWSSFRGTLAGVLPNIGRQKTSATRADSSGPSGLRRRIDAALTSWLDGEASAALREIAEARELVPDDPTARVLEGHLHHLEPSRSLSAETEVRQMAKTLEAFREGNYGEAIERLPSATIGFHPALPAAVLGLSLSGHGELRRAEPELSLAARLLPRCLRIHRELGALYVRLAKLPEAERVLLQASELAPQSADVWRELACVYEQQGSLENGFEAAEHASRFDGGHHGGTLRIIASLRDQAGEREAARAILDTLIEQNPADHASHHILGLSFDRDHRIAEAARCYREALSIHPTHAPSLINLAYLYSGALRGKCHNCDRAYAENPDCLDLEKAEHYLARAIETDRGADPVLGRTAVDVALRLENRIPIIFLLEDLTRDRPRTPEVLQLEHTLRVLRIAEHEGTTEDS